MYPGRKIGIGLTSIPKTVFLLLTSSVARFMRGSSRVRPQLYFLCV